MNDKFKKRVLFLLAGSFGIAAFLLCSGCASPYANAGIGVGVATVTGSYAPAHEIEQIYYLGVFDPQEQIPPTIYRVTVHGQASFISGTKFASGWVPAKFVDSLNSRLDMDANNSENPLKISPGDQSYLSDLKPGRRLVMFGPEGFREAPKDHRLVIVMGASPKAFFDAVDTTLGQISQVRAERADSAVGKKVFQAMTQLRNQKDRIADFSKDVEQDMPQTSAN